MLLTFLLLLLFSNGLTIRPDTSILYSRIGLLIIFYSIISSMSSFYITYLQKGIGLYNGLFNITPITHSFQIFILLVSGIILLMGGLSSCFILLGIALIYANSGLTNLDGMYSIISDSEKYLNFST